MDERLKYEQLIGGKLQSLPVPDMQDAIWARIKAQLDIDLPTDDGDGGGSPQTPSGPRIIGWGLSVLIIALVTTFLLLKNKSVSNTDTKSNNTPPVEQSNAPSVQNNSPPVQNNNNVNRTTGPATTANDNLPAGIGNDSAVQQDLGVIVPPVVDTARTNMPPPSLTLITPQKADSNLQVKKGRGMTGLNDSGYRIVPKNKN